MKCKECLPESIEESLTLKTELYEDNHDCADILRCDSCLRLFLYYWVEVWDDGWSYWVEITEKEYSDLCKIDMENYPKYELIKIIKTKEKVICRHPDGEHLIQTGAMCVLDGPPW